MARPIARGVLSFGLVAIPVEIHTATKSQNVSFNLLHAKCGSRIRNQIFCPACKIVVERADLVRGYEVAKGEYVRLTDAELESLEAEANRNIELKEFIPIQKIDPFYFERSYYLAPDEGGEKAYRLLAETMEKVGRTALAEMVSHDKEKLVLIRAAQGGLIMQVMHYANEVRDFGAIPKAEQERLTPTETDLAKGLVEKLSSEDFEPEAYADEYRKRVLAMLDEKQKGREIRIARPAPSAGHVVDLMEALKRSMRETQVGRAKETAKGRKKA